jgi:hypothetical protein
LPNPNYFPEQAVDIQAEQERRNTALHKMDHSHIPPCGSAAGTSLEGLEPGDMKGSTGNDCRTTDRGRPAIVRADGVVDCCKSHRMPTRTALHPKIGGAIDDGLHPGDEVVGAVDPPSPVSRAASQAVVVAVRTFLTAVLSVAGGVACVRMRVPGMRSAKWQRDIGCLVGNDGGRND